MKHIPVLFCRYTCLFILFMIAVPALSLAELKALTDSELKEQTAQAGITDITIGSNTARVFLDVHIETWTTVDSFKSGYYDNGSAGFGWDHDWTDVSFGDVDNDFVIDGLLVKMDFDDLTAPNPDLQRVIFGTNRIQGTMTANFNSFTGTYNPALTPEEDDDTAAETLYSRSALPYTQWNFDSSETNMGMFLIMNTAPENPGIHVVAGYNETNISAALTGLDWSDLP